MNPRRGEVWLADPNPIRGSEQAGLRPVLVLQNDVINAYTTTFVAVPLTTNLRRADLPSCVRLSRGDGGLVSDSVALCHQIRVLDRDRFSRKLGLVRQKTIVEIENRILFTLGIV
jgi:mRNA interferase MazF